MARQNGGILGVVNNPTGPSGTNVAKGMWSLQEQTKHRKAGNWPTPPVPISYLVVGGGGAGGPGGNSGGGGGGGAGGFLDSSNTLLTEKAYTITVGAGGAVRTSGSASILGTISVAGGGRGAGWAYPPVMVSSEEGGSGGGAGLGNQYAKSGSFVSLPIRGNAGGDGITGGTYPGGGGGGAGGVGGNAADSNTGGNGGVGYQSSITGSSVYYAGGGGAGSYGGTAGTGGAGGGGAGSSSTSINGYNGSSNTGGGGGGATYGNAGNKEGGTGGSGVIILKIPDTRSASFSVGVSPAPTLTTITGYKIYTCTGGDGTVTFS